MITVAAVVTLVIHLLAARHGRMRARKERERWLSSR